MMYQVYTSTAPTTHTDMHRKYIAAPYVTMTYYRIQVFTSFGMVKANRRPCQSFLVQPLRVVMAAAMESLLAADAELLIGDELPELGAFRNIPQCLLCFHDGLSPRVDVIF